LKPILWRLTAASAGVLVALSMNVGPVSASSSQQHPRPERGPVQVADQSARTDQDAHSYAKSEQFLPINANVPVQILSLGSNGGTTTQSNNSTAKSNASNQAWTDQSLHQTQVAPKPEGPKPHDGGWKPEGPKGHKPDGKGRDCPKPEDPKGHGPKAPEGPAPAFQGASQSAHTDQDAHSSAKSEQFLPINANVPVQILSLGSNGGTTTQSNNSTAKSTAANEAWTDQSAGQHQSTWGQQPEGPKGRDGDGKPDGPKGPDGDGPKAPEGPAPAFQGASQHASTDQNADSSATSKQIAPVNANVPIQILSLGSNGGDTTQSNNSTAKSAATNEAGTDQSAHQQQQAGSAPAFQGASQHASTDQNADSSAKSEQIAPVNANVPIQILSLGSNGGDTTQSNNSTATSSATNQAGTSQVLGQAQGAVGGLLG
jgi:transcriptional regulator of met regulon